MDPGYDVVTSTGSPEVRGSLDPDVAYGDIQGSRIVSQTPVPLYGTRIHVCLGDKNSWSTHDP